MIVSVTMNKMCKWLSLWLVLVLLLSLCACGIKEAEEDEDEDEDTFVTTSSTKSDTPPTVEATALLMDGEQIAVVEDGDALQALLEEIKTAVIPVDSIPDNAEEQRVEFVQTVEMIADRYPPIDLVSIEELRKRLTATAVVKVEYTVQAGDTFAGIAEKHNMTVEEIKQLNALENIDNLQIGQVLVIQHPQYFLQVKVTYTLREEGVKVPYKTRTVYREDKPTDFVRTITKGVNGEKTVVTEVTVVNGREISSEVVEEIVTKEAVSEVREIGTQKVTTSTTQGDGAKVDEWVWPVPVCHNVYQGYHSGHLAIDISSGPVPVLGKPAVAANGGEVIYVGWYYDYGYCVRIQHDGGLVTVYAHLDSVSVVTGQKVSAGQEIGKVGNTGNSPGPHLHFEVIKNGIKVNPLNYVKP